MYVCACDWRKLTECVLCKQNNTLVRMLPTTIFPPQATRCSNSLFFGFWKHAQCSTRHGTHTYIAHTSNTRNYFQNFPARYGWYWELASYATHTLYLSIHTETVPYRIKVQISIQCVNSFSTWQTIYSQLRQLSIDIEYRKNRREKKQKKTTKLLKFYNSNVFPFELLCHESGLRLNYLNEVNEVFIVFVVFVSGKI